MFYQHPLQPQVVYQHPTFTGCLSLCPTCVSAVEREVDGRVEDDEERVGHDEDLGPRRKVPHRPAQREHVDHLVQRDHDLQFQVVAAA